MPEQIAYLWVPDFSMMAFTASIEPLRTLNRLGGSPHSQWQTFSIDGAPVRASNGVECIPDGSVADIGQASLVLVCAGLNLPPAPDRVWPVCLRRLARRIPRIGGLCTGPLLLARAGLLEGYRCTIHWENVESFAEEFPDLDIRSSLYEIDRDRITCSGGTAPLDLMVHLIGVAHGQAVAVQVAESMLHHAIRSPEDAQRLPLRQRLGVAHPKLLAAIAHMEASLESPLPIEAIAVRAGLSPRQTERLFRMYLGRTPTRWYLELRLKRARGLMMQTSMPVQEIAVACGFSSASHFAACYRAMFGHAPRQDRGQPGAQAASRRASRS